jgi:hypothetical protein
VCDRTTSRRGSSTRISLSDSRLSENTINTHNTLPYIEAQVEVITTYVHVLVIQKRDEAKIMLQVINQSLQKQFLSTVRTFSLP